MKIRKLDTAIAADIWKIFLPPIKRGNKPLLFFIKLSNSPVITSTLVQK